MEFWRGASGARRAVLVGLFALVVIWLPGTLASDIRGLRSALRLSAQERAEARGPGAQAATDLALVRLAQTEIPPGGAYAVLTTARWRARHTATAREAGGSWTQFALAPRVQVARKAAGWMLILDSSPRGAGIARPLHAWRSGSDWLVEVR
jgi:hypothetical protein